MPPPVIGSVGTGLALSTANNAAVPVPSGVAAGHIIIVDLYMESVQTVTPPAGFAAMGAALTTSQPQQHTRWWKRATAGDTGTYTFTWGSSTPRRAQAVRYTDCVGTGAPYEQLQGASRSSAGTTHPPVSLTTTGANRLVVWSATNYSAGTATPPTNFTELVDTEELTIATRVLAVAGSVGTVTGTSTASGHMTAGLFALLPVAFQPVAPASIAPTAAFGTATLTRGPVTVIATGIVTAESVSSPSVVRVISPVGITSGEAFGIPVSGNAFSPLGIQSAEAFGAVTINNYGLGPAGIPTGQAFGTPTINRGPVSLSPGSITTAEAFGAPKLNLRILAFGIESDLAFGSTQVQSVVIRQRAVPQRTIPRYELVCVARIPQTSSDPTFMEIDPIDWTSIDYTDELSTPQSLSAGCKISNLTDPVLQRLRKPHELATELWVYRNGKIVFAGPLMGWNIRNDEIVLEARGLAAYLNMMAITADMSFADKDQFTIAKALVDQWQNLSYGNFGIDTDGIAVSGVNRSVSYVAKELHLVGTKIADMSGGENGFDYGVDPTSRKLNLYYPQQGIDRSDGENAVIFDDRNVTSTNIVCSIAPGDVASEGIGSGTNTDGDSLFSVQENLELRSTYGRAAFIQSFSEKEQAKLDEKLRGALNVRAEALMIPGPNTRVTPDSDLSAYDVGDTVSYTLHNKLDVQGAFRLRKRQVSVSNTGTEAVTLQFV